MIQIWYLRQNGSIFSYNQLFDFLSDAPMATRSITDIRAAGMCKQKPPASTNDFALQAFRPVFICEIGKLEQNPIHLDSIEALVSYFDTAAEPEERLHKKPDRSRRSGPFDQEGE